MKRRFNATNDNIQVTSSSDNTKSVKNMLQQLQDNSRNDPFQTLQQQQQQQQPNLMPSYFNSYNNATHSHAFAQSYPSYAGNCAMPDSYPYLNYAFPTTYWQPSPTLLFNPSQPPPPAYPPTTEKGGVNSKFNKFGKSKKVHFNNRTFAPSNNGDDTESRTSEEAAEKRETVVKSRGKRKSSANNAPSTPWCREDAVKAIELEKEYKVKRTTPSLILKFPDPALNSEIVKKFSSMIETVHFQQPSTPRYCFVNINPLADIEQVKEELCEIPFGNGKIVAEFKHAIDEQQVEPEDIDPYTIYVGNLPAAVSVKYFKSLFKIADRIDVGWAQKLKQTRYAFIRYSSIENAIEAFKEAAKLILGARTLFVRFRRNRGNVCLSTKSNKHNAKKNDGSLVLDDSQYDEDNLDDDTLEKMCDKTYYLRRENWDDYLTVTDGLAAEQNNLSAMPPPPPHSPTTDSPPPNPPQPPLPPSLSIPPPPPPSLSLPPPPPPPSLPPRTPSPPPSTPTPPPPTPSPPPPSETPLLSEPMQTSTSTLITSPPTPTPTPPSSAQTESIYSSTSSTAAQQMEQQSELLPIRIKEEPNDFSEIDGNQNNDDSDDLLGTQIKAEVLETVNYNLNSDLFTSVNPTKQEADDDSDDDDDLIRESILRGVADDDPDDNQMNHYWEKLPDTDTTIANETSGTNERSVSPIDVKVPVDEIIISSSAIDEKRELEDLFNKLNPDVGVFL